MYFEEVLPLLRRGAKARLKSWAEGEFIFIKSGKFRQVVDEKEQLYYLVGREIIDDDWEIYEERSEDEKIQG